MIRFGVLGLGNIAHRFCKSLIQNEEAKLWAVASSSVEKQLQFQELYGAKKLYTNYQDLILDENIDVIYIATRHIDHARWVEASLKAKKAVLCEKPMALNEAKTKELCELAKKENVFLMEALKGYFVPGTDHLVHQIQQGCIGEVTLVEANFNSEVPFMPEKYLFEKGQGGALNDVGIYPLSFVLKIIDEPVQTMEVSYEQHPQAVVDSYFQAVMSFKTGKKAVICGAIDRNEKKVAVIHGTKGSIIVPSYYRLTDYTLKNAEIEKNYHIEMPVDDIQGEIREVINCLKSHVIESSVYGFDKMIEIAHYQQMIREKMVLTDD